MSFLTHPFFVLAMSLRPEELPIDQRKYLENAPRPMSPPAVLPKPVQTSETPEPRDTTGWPVCYKCNRPFSTKLALRHHLASVFHHPTEHPAGAEDVSAGEESWVCEVCVDRRVFKSALALRMHGVNGSHTSDVYKTPEQVEALPTSGWGKPMTSPKLPIKVTSEDTRVEEALTRIAEEIGKTKRVNFSDAMLSEIDTEAEATQILIVSATRDLALLVHTLLATRCANFGITTYACVGGTVVRHDMAALLEGPHIVSGTPGRVSDMIRRRALRTERIRLLVLNKEDMLLNRSMWPQLADVYGLLDPETKVVRASVRVREGTV